MIAGYGIKYYYEFYGLRQQDGSQSPKKRIEIHKKDYTGSTSQLDCMGAKPITVTMQADGNELYAAQIIATSCNLQLVSRFFGEWDHISTASDDEWVIELYIDEALKGRWFVIPENTQEQIYQGNTITNIEATDKLGDLSLYTWGELITQMGDTDFLRWTEIYIEMMKIIGHEQHFRIVNNLIEDTDGVSFNTTPIQRAYMDVEVYDESTTLDTILKDMLLTLHASIRSCNGYWYIMRYEEAIQENVNFKEFAENTYISSGTFEPVKTYREDWRWMGSQGKKQEFQYKAINLNINLEIKDFITESWADWQYQTNDATGSLTSLISQNDEEIQISVEATRITTITKEIQEVDLEGDLISIKFDAEVNQLIHNHLAPYIPLLYTVVINNSLHYESATGSWGSSETINQYFLNVGEEQTVELEFTLPDISVKGDIEISLSQVSANYYDIYYETEEDLIAGLKAIYTLNLSEGSRLIVSLSNAVNYYYELIYETDRGDLPEDDDIYIIVPNSTTEDRRWHLVETNSTLRSIETISTYKNLEIDITVNKEEVEDSAVIQSAISSSGNQNTLDEITVVHHDEIEKSNAFLKSKSWIRFGYSQQTPSSSWTYNGYTSSIQEHLLRQLAELYQRSRWIVQSNMFSDEIIDPLSLFKLVDEIGNIRLFVPMGLTFDYKNHQYEGEIKEYTYMENINRVWDDRKEWDDLETWQD